MNAKTAVGSSTCLLAPTSRPASVAKVLTATYATSPHGCPTRANTRPAGAGVPVAVALANATEGAPDVAGAIVIGEGTAPKRHTEPLLLGLPRGSSGVRQALEAALAIHRVGGDGATLVAEPPLLPLRKRSLEGVPTRGTPRTSQMVGGRNLVRAARAVTGRKLPPHVSATRPVDTSRLLPD